MQKKTAEKFGDFSAVIIFLKEAVCDDGRLFLFESISVCQDRIRQLLQGANKPDGEPNETVAVVRRAEVVLSEAHAAGLEHTTGGRRPIDAV